MLSNLRLSAIIEALLVASDDPLPQAELARLIRARIAELEDERLAVEEENGSESEDYTADESAEESPAALPPEYLALAETTEIDIQEGIQELNESYQATGRAFLILERAKGWKLYTNPDFGGFVKHLFPGRKPKRLSGPAMETLAVIAYRQPVTKAAIDAVRGVSSDGMLQKLLDLELVKIGGRADLPGRPLLYETTDFFFEHFGIKSPDELPNALELRRMELPDAPEELPEEEENEEKPANEISTEDIRQAHLAQSASLAQSHASEETPIPDSAEADPRDGAEDFAEPASDTEAAMEEEAL